MKRIILAISLALVLSGCAGTKLGQIYTLATTSTVPADIVRPTANTFDILKGTAANFAVYCINNKFAPTGCDVGTRRKISTAVKDGTKARIQMRSALATNQPVLSTIYNLLVGAVNDLQSSPVNGFTGG